MPLILSGTNGVSGVDGSAGTPSYQGNDTNTGIFYPAADTIAFAEGGTEVMRIDSSGNVGIDTSSPAYRLQVRRSGGAGSLGVTINNTVGFTRDVQYYSVADSTSDTTGHAFYVRNGSATDNLAMRIDSSGNVGIGTSSPTDRLTIVGTGETGAPADGGSKTASIRVAATGGGGNDGGQIEFGYGFGSYTQSYFSAIKGLGSNGAGNTLGHLAFYTRNATGDTSLTERMRIDSSGNVGIGTSSPLGPLQIGTAPGTVGTGFVGLTFRSAGNPSVGQGYNIRFDNTQNVSNDLGQISYSFGGGSGSSAGYMFFSTAAAERMRITSGGVLMVGTTGLPAENGSALSLSGTGRVARIYGTTESLGALTVDKSTNTNTTSQIFVQFSINAQQTGNGQINGNGASQAAFGSFSDRRLKENIVDLPSQLSKIMALRPVEFDYIESEGGGHQISFIAQEFEEVYPDAIGERADGMKTLTGWGKTEAILVKAIQEQQAMIEELKQEVAKLKGV